MAAIIEKGSPGAVPRLADPILDIAALKDAEACARGRAQMDTVVAVIGK